ncbi:MAG TPA: D-aminoacylase [Longimicrobiales bacterium]
MKRLALFLTALLTTASALTSQTTSYDLILRGGRVVDGTGAAAVSADVAISNGRIARIAPRITDAATRVLDVRGQVIAPGFIDIHSHASRDIFERPTAESYLRQGVTTLMTGPDGSSAVPLAPYLAKLDSTRMTVNVGSMVGQGSVRQAVMGSVDRKTTPDELQRMRDIVEQAMKDGAYGLSTGLFYVPGNFTPTEEVIDLAKVAARYGGMHKSHMRDEARHVVESVKETIRIGEEGGLPTQVTHHKIIGQPNWGRSVETLRLVDEARKRGVDVTLDMYPYTASSTSVVAALLPQWAQEGGRQQLLLRLNDPPQRARIKAETVRLLNEERGGGNPRNVVLASCGFDATLSGKNLADIAVMRGLQPTVEYAADAALWIAEQGGCSGIFHAISEDDLRRIIVHPQTMIASDGGIPSFGSGHPHPRNYGTFARVLSEYVREKKFLTLEQAVWKMAGFPAQRLGLKDRGVLKQGMMADIAVFDPARVRDVSTFDKPHAYSEGVSLVLVNGEVVFENNAVTAARPGRVLRKHH